MGTIKSGQSGPRNARTVGEDKFYTAQKRQRCSLLLRGHTCRLVWRALSQRRARAHRLSMRASARRKDKGNSNCGDVQQRKREREGGKSVVTMEKVCYTRVYMPFCTTTTDTNERPSAAVVANFTTKSKPPLPLLPFSAERNCASFVGTRKK